MLLCCNPKTKLLAHAMMTDPKQAAYLFGFQQDILRAEMTPEVGARFNAVLQPIITENFAQTPSAMPALLAMTGDAFANMATNDRRVPELGRFAKPVKFIWAAATNTSVRPWQGTSPCTFRRRHSRCSLRPSIGRSSINRTR
jgi:hypothetical protein